MPAKTDTSYFPLAGGLDLTTPSLSVLPGRALVLNNYEPWFNGGYRRIDGFERFDGRPKPSEQTFSGFDVTTVAGLSLGDTITGDTSGATGVLRGIWDDDGTYGSDAIGVAKVSGGPFVNGEDCNTSAFTISTSPVENYAPSISLENIWLLAAQDDYRDDIGVVPGAGNVLAAWQRLANVYAVRNNIGNTAGILHKSSSSGWTTTGITLASHIYFDAGGGGTAQALPAEGDTVTGLTSGASATVHRVILHAGSTTGNDAEGYLVLTSISGGPFQNNEPLQESATTFATSEGADVQHVFPANGDYKFINHNFFAGSGTYRTYGVSGTGPGFEIDENNIVSPILMPFVSLPDQPANNTPILVEEHRNYLFLAFPGGTFIHTVLGLPLTINGFLGAAEFGVGDEITGLSSLTGSVLAVTSERETRGLFGKDTSDWDFKVIGEKTGGRFHTPKKLDTLYAFDDLGITSLTRTDAFGDFVGATVSQLIQPLVNLQRDKITDATVVRKANQYRVYFDDGTGLIMYIPNAGMSVANRSGTRIIAQFGAMSYPFPVRNIYNTDDENGAERTYFTTDSGYVYEDQIGRNFDGEKISSSARLVFNKLKSPSYRKRFRRAVLEIDTKNELTLSVVSDLSYGGTDSASGSSTQEVAAGGGFFDVDRWDEVVFDGQVIATPVIPLAGSGTNIGLLIHNDSAHVDPFILQGVTLHYDIRRLQRG